MFTDKDDTEDGPNHVDDDGDYDQDDFETLPKGSLSDEEAMTTSRSTSLLTRLKRSRFTCGIMITIITTIIPDICKKNYSSTFQVLKILHSIVHKFATKTVLRQNSIN